MPCTRCKQKRVTCESRPTRRYAGQPTIYDTSNGFTSHTFSAKPYTFQLDTLSDQPAWGNHAAGQPPSQVSHGEVWSSSPTENEHFSKANVSAVHGTTAITGIESQDVHQGAKQSPDYPTSPDGIEYIVPLDDVDYPSGQADYFIPRSETYTMPSTTMTMNPDMNGIGDIVDFGFQQSLFDPKPSPPQVHSPLRSDVPAVKHTVLESATIRAAQDHWSCFRCNPPLAQSPSETAGAHLDSLVETLTNQDAWDSLDVQQAESDLAMSKTISTEPVLRSVRDRLLDYTRQLFRSVLESRLPASRAQSPTEEDLESTFNQAEQLNLPPPHVLRYFLRAFVCGFEPFYPTVARGTLNPDVLLDERSNYSPLLLLLLFAQGAMTDPTLEARTFSSGLTEICRFALNQALEREVFVIRVDPAFMRNALHYLNLAAWGGDRCHMDV